MGFNSILKEARNTNRIAVANVVFVMMSLARKNERQKEAVVKLDKKTKRQKEVIVWLEGEMNQRHHKNAKVANKEDANIANKEEADIANKDLATTEENEMSIRLLEMFEKEKLRHEGNRKRRERRQHKREERSP